MKTKTVDELMNDIQDCLMHNNITNLSWEWNDMAICIHVNARHRKVTGASDAKHHGSLIYKKMTN